MRLVNPIFLLCSERSGSNLVTSVFDAHSQIAGPGTAHLCSVLGRLTGLHNASCEQLAKDVATVFDVKMSSWHIDSWAPKERLNLILNEQTTEAMIAALYQAEAEEQSKSIAFVKENSIHAFMPFIMRLSENPRFVFTVRDPRAMAASWLKAPSLRGGVKRACDRWLYDQTAHSALYTELSEKYRCAQFTYEALVTAPESTLQNACSALDIEFEPSMLKFNTVSKSAQQNAQKISLWANLASPINAKSTETFWHSLSVNQLAYVEARCASLMKQFGYQTRHSNGLNQFGDFDDFASLERHIIEIEPWEKPEFQSLPEAEQAVFHNWASTIENLRKSYAGDK